MTYPLLWLPAALRAEGLTVKTVAGWQTRGRPYTYEGAHGVMFHHTASSPKGGNAPSLGICTNGRSDLPGPLCHVLVARDGTCYVVAAGYANHAGYGGPWKTVPQDSGNKYIVGIEVENAGTGSEPWSAKLVKACDRVFAAVLRHQKRNSSWLIGHKEWAPGRKIDPCCQVPATNMAAARLRVSKLLAPPPPPAPTGPAYPGHVLKRGMTEKAVTTFSAQLKKLGFSPSKYLYGVGPHFGDGKVRAVKAFQRKRNLTVDGMVGPQTWKALWS